MSETGSLLPVPFQASPLLLFHHTFAPTTVMSSVRPMTPADLLKFNPCNLDHLTETYNIGFYLDYFSKWPELCMVIEAPHGEIEGYSQ
jgi:ribosomal protein S18 acetylase RimI-like enzyme